MSERYKVRNRESLYFITITTINWIDVFTRPAMKHIIIESLIHCQQEKGLCIHAYVLMSNHLHAILSASGDVGLQEIMRDFKKYTSKKIVEQIIGGPESRSEWMLDAFSEASNKNKRGKCFKVWQDGFHPIELVDNKMIDQRLDYIHNNPIEADVVTNPEDYKYSSAINYCGSKGSLEVNLIE